MNVSASRSETFNLGRDLVPTKIGGMRDGSFKREDDLQKTVSD